MVEAVAQPILGRHRAFHRRVAEALELHYRANLDGVAGLIASHFAEGLAAERATAYALRAGQEAARMAAWDEAIAFFEQALAATPAEGAYGVLMALGDAHLQAGQSARAGERYQAAAELASAPADELAARLGLCQALLGQARFAEMIAQARQVGQIDHPHAAAQALFLWGTALSVEGSDLEGAAERLAQARALFTHERCANPAARAQASFELGSVAAQRGELEQAVERYRETLAIAEADGGYATLQWRILAHNNLGYHLLLLGRLAEAEAHAQAGMQLAEERGSLAFMSYLQSTTGEIAMARGALDAAERAFQRGLAIAERLSVPERIAGLTANLGLLAAIRGDSALAVHRLSTALAHADDLGTCHLAAQVRIWLAPLLPPAAARALLAEARAIAEQGGRRRLLDELRRAEEALGA